MTIGQRYAQITENIENVCRSCGRDPAEVTLIAVTKTRSAEEINEAVALGIHHVGENRVQELLSKVDTVTPGTSFHLIGQLQTNKVKYILDKVSLIQSLDRVSLAEEIQKTAQKQKTGKKDVLIEVNIGKEPSKSGIFPENLSENLDIFARFEYINPVGLMTVAPADASEKEQMVYFEAMRELLKKGQAVFGSGFKELSMGMSRDYTAAIRQGSTMIRLGTALFGERNYNI